MAKQYTDEEILAYKDKANTPTPTQERYADWLIEKCELEFPNEKAEKSFRYTVALSTALRMIFQASPENQAVREENRTAREAAASEPKQTAKPVPADDADPKPAKKTPAKKTAKATPAPVADDADTSVAPPAKPSAPKKAARAGKPAPF